MISNMLKQKILLLSLCSLLILSQASSSFAATITPTSTPASPTSQSTTEKLTNQINNLKEKIASRVAELNLVEKRGIMGIVKEVTNNQITITDMQNKSRVIEVDELTKFSSPQAGEFGISDIKTGSKIGVLGLYNKDSERLLARFINTISLAEFISGVVKSVDPDKFTVTILSENGTETIVDIENVTKTTIDTGTESEKSGFSKIQPGSRAIVIGFPDAKEKNRIVGTRLLLFPQLPKNPKIVITDVAGSNDEVVTSTGSGKKLTPLTQPR